MSSATTTHDSDAAGLVGPGAIWRAHTLAAAGLVVAAVPLVAMWLASSPGRDRWLLLIPLGALGGVGALLAGRRSSAGVGWLMLAVAAPVEIAVAAGSSARADGTPGDWVPWAAWLGTWTWWPAATAAVCLLQVFPGRRPGHQAGDRQRFRAPLVATVAAGGLAVLATALARGPLDGFTTDNPVGVLPESPAVRGVADVASTVVLGLGVVALLGLFVRRQRARGVERRQLSWLVAGVGLLAVTGAFAMVSPRATNELSFVLLMLGVTAVPVSVAVAVLRHGLFDVEALLHRAVVWLGVLATLGACYVAVLLVVGRLLASAAGVGATLLATVAVVALLSAVRDVARGMADRLVYGVRRDPVAAMDAVLDAVTAAADAKADMPRAVVDVLAERLRLRDVALELDGPRGRRSVARRGDPGPDALVVEVGSIGRLLVGPPDDLSPSDRRLLSAIARPLAAELHGARLALQLQQSRESLVLAREEERRQLQRDLHDGVGPRLAGLGLGLDTAAALLPADVDGARATIERLRARNDAALQEVRRVARGLGPPALEHGELGTALRLLATDVAGDLARLDIDPDADSLPAAVQVGLFHVAAEAMSNAVRHGRARHVAVSLHRDGADVVLRVADDGPGLPADAPAGTGMGSMRERCAELGGSLAVSSGPDGGTVVVAWAPGQ